MKKLITLLIILFPLVGFGNCEFIEVTGVQPIGNNVKYIYVTSDISAINYQKDDDLVRIYRVGGTYEDIINFDDEKEAKNFFIGAVKKLKKCKFK